MVSVSLLTFILLSCKADDYSEYPIQVSKVYPLYFVTGKGETWIPIATNYLPPNSAHKYVNNKPIVINEIGAVEPHHVGPFRHHFQRFKNAIEGSGEDEAFHV